jgi:hypothetical protein
MNLDFNGTNSSTFSTGNAPKNLIIDQCYMADHIHIDAKSKIDSRKRKRNSIPDSPQNSNLTPVTIMVADISLVQILDPLQLLSIRNVYLRSVDHTKYLRVEW